MHCARMCVCARARVCMRGGHEDLSDGCFWCHEHAAAVSAHAGVFAIRTEHLSTDFCMWKFFESGRAIDDAQALYKTAQCIAFWTTKAHHEKGVYSGRGDVHLSDTAKANIHTHLVSTCTITSVVVACSSD